MKNAIRYDDHGQLTALCWDGSYVMVRRPRAMPFVMTLKDWRLLPETPPKAKESAA